MLEVGVCPRHIVIFLSHILKSGKKYTFSQRLTTTLTVLSTQAINALPPLNSLSLGQFDNVIMNINPAKEWPSIGLTSVSIISCFKFKQLTLYYPLLGHIIVGLQLIFWIIPSYPHETYGNWFLTYVRWFDIAPQINPAISGPRNQTQKGLYPEPLSGLYLLKQLTWSTGATMGNVLLLDQIRSLANLTPHFGEKASRFLTKENSLEYSAEFWLNKYFTKELFLALHLHPHVTQRSDMSE